MSFLFAAALWALPLASLPVLLHLLFRRKSPVVLFSTLRFVRVSVQQTAARKRVQRWLLLACRMLLLGLLIWAVAQPARKLASAWFGGNSLAAAVVVDTSYSMMLQDGQVTLLDKAGGTVRDLLQGPLANANVAMFLSRPAAEMETLTRTGSYWAPMFFKPLTPQAARTTLGERVNAAMNLLRGAGAQQKWLIIISDLQTREFSHPVTDFPQGQILLIDLHPDQPRNAGVSNVAIEPEQPLPGLQSEAVVEVLGRSGDTRAVSVALSKPDGTALASHAPPQMAGFDGSGRAQVRLPVQMPAERWVLLNATLAGDDDMSWDNQRCHLVEIPPRQTVTLLESPGRPLAQRFLKLALDPYAGAVNTWPLDVKSQTDPTGHENVVVAPLTEWPSEARALKLRDFARAGGTVILLLQPGLEESWAALPDAQKTALLELLPSTPLTIPPPDGNYRASVATAVPDPLLTGLTDEKFQLKAIVVHRFVSMNRIAGRDSAKVSAILNVTPINPGPAPQGVFFRRGIGTGTVFTLTTLTDARYTNLATHPLFLPLLVRMSLRPLSQSNAMNIELGDSMALSASLFPGVKTLLVDPPGGGPSVKVDATDDREKGQVFQFNDATAAGVYSWHLPSESNPLAMVNVSLPARESELTYRPAETVVRPGERTWIARSYADLQQKMNQLNEPQPLWSWPITIVLLLLCLEALMGNLSRIRKASVARPGLVVAA